MENTAPSTGNESLGNQNTVSDAADTASVGVAGTAAGVRLLCLDVDGVLTDGRLYVGEKGDARRAFHTQDGFAIRWFIRLGGQVAILTGKQSQSVAWRAAELGIQHVVQGSENKLADLRPLLEHLQVPLAQVAMIGDDLPDLPVLRVCGWPVAVANAVDEVKSAVRYVTQRRGGDGAVREALEHLMRSSGQWQCVIGHYERQATGHTAQPANHAAPAGRPYG